MTEAVRLARTAGNVVWVDLRRRRGPDPFSILAAIVALAAFAAATCVTAGLLAEAIVAWVGHDRGFAQNLISASSFL